MLDYQRITQRQTHAFDWRHLDLSFPGTTGPPGAMPVDFEDFALGLDTEFPETIKGSDSEGALLQACMRMQTHTYVCYVPTVSRPCSSCVSHVSFFVFVRFFTRTPMRLHTYAS